MAYANEYKVQGKNSDERPFEEITLTFLREGKPRKLLQYLEKRGVKISKNVKGIYLIEDLGFFPIQIVAYGEIEDKDSCKWLKLLTRKLKYDDAVSFMQAAEKMQVNAQFQRMADSVMEIAFKQNSEIFAKIFSEGDMLKLNALRFLF